MPQEAAHADTLMSAAVYPVAPVLAHLYILRLKNPQNYPTISAAIAAIVVFVLWTVKLTFIDAWRVINETKRNEMKWSRWRVG